MNWAQIGPTTIAGLQFDASFDGGNAASVEQVDDSEFTLYTSPDCADTQFEKGFRTWWQFSVRGVAKGRVLTFNIKNMNSQGKLFRQDMRPVVRSLPSKPNWSRLPLQPQHSGTKEEDNFVLTFRHKCDAGPDNTIYFAFCFPSSYCETMAKLAWLDAVFQLPPAPVALPPRASPVAVTRLSLEAATKGALAPTPRAGQHDDDSTSPPSSTRSSASGSSGGGSQPASRGGGFASSTTSSRGPSAPPSAPPSAASSADLLAVARIVAGAAAQEASEAPPARGPVLGRERERNNAQQQQQQQQLAEAAEPPPVKVPRGVLAAAAEAAASHPAAASSPTHAELTAAAVASAHLTSPHKKPSSIYYHRELLCRSLEGRRIDLLTISGSNGMLAEREAPLGAPGCMPEGGDRPRAFANKPVFMLSARVHPGETPASHVFDGFLAFLLKESDPRAKVLREKFVFKLVPIINPDGVFRGHYRADTRGMNLNRTYLIANAQQHPSVHAIGAVVRQLNARGELLFYVDTHAHATKRGCFLYGNAIQDPESGSLTNERMIDNVMYAKLVAANCRWFDFGGCVFSERNMYGKDRRDGLSKEGSGRVAAFKATNLTYVYTLECNYNMGRVVNRLQPVHTPRGVDKNAVSPPPPPLRTLSPKYTPECWRSVGKGLALAALDVLGLNPCSRLGPPNGAAYSRLRGSVAAWVKSYAKKEAKRAAARPRGGDSDEEEADEEEEAEEEEEEAEGEEDGGDEDDCDEDEGEEEGCKTLVASLALQPRPAASPRSLALQPHDYIDGRLERRVRDGAAVAAAVAGERREEAVVDVAGVEALTPRLAATQLAPPQAYHRAGEASEDDDGSDDEVHPLGFHGLPRPCSGLVRHAGGHRMHLQVPSPPSAGRGAVEEGGGATLHYLDAAADLAGATRPMEGFEGLRPPRGRLGGRGFGRALS